MTNNSGAGGEFCGDRWVAVSSVSDRYPVYVTANNPTPISYISGEWTYSPSLDDMVLKNSPYAPTEAERKKQKELDSYNQIYGRSAGIGMAKGTYLFWREEFEATGAEFAKERMLEAYKRGDEEKWEERLQSAKSKRFEISIWRDTPLLYILGAIGVVFVMLMLIVL